MGIRSDVGIILTVEAYNEAMKFIKNKGVNDEKNILLETENITILPSGNLFLHYEYVKWYDFFEDVGTFMEALEHLEENDMGDCFTFVEMCETGDDKYLGELYSGDNEDLYIIRELVTPDKDDGIQLKEGKLYIFINLSTPSDLFI